MLDAKPSWNNDGNLWILQVQTHLDCIKSWYHTVKNYDILPCPRPVNIGCLVNSCVYYSRQKSSFLYKQQSCTANEKYKKYKSVIYFYKPCIHDIQTAVLISPSLAYSGNLRLYLKCYWVRVAVWAMLYEGNIATECTGEEFNHIIQHLSYYWKQHIVCNVDSPEPCSEPTTSCVT